MNAIATRTISETIDAAYAALVDADTTRSVWIEYRQDRKPVGALIVVTYRPQQYGQAGKPGALGWIDVTMHAVDGLTRPADATFRRINNGITVMLAPTAIEYSERASVPACQHNGTRATYTDCHGFIVRVTCDDCESVLPIECVSCYRTVSVADSASRCADCARKSVRPVTGAGYGVGILGKPNGVDYSAIRADKGNGTRIGWAYLQAPEYDDRPIVRRCYDAFIRETWEQLERMRQAGIHVSVSDTDPYASFAEMATDVRENGRLSVLSSVTTGGHPYLSCDDNDAFRAVHDYYGHFMSGRDFTRHGEEAAFQRHARMYGTYARAAMTVETRGQNSAYVWVLGGGENFPVQKFTLLPVWATYCQTDIPMDSDARAIERARQLQDPHGFIVGSGVGVGIASTATTRTGRTRAARCHNGPTVEVQAPRARYSRRPADALARVFGTTTRAVVARILAYYDGASADERAAGVEWYESARDHAAIISWQHSAPIENVVAVISHLSPQTSWSVNLAGAYSIYENGTAPRCMGDNIARARIAMHARDPFATFGSDAPKTKSFYMNILGREDYVTIDVWALRAAIGMDVEESRLGRVGAYDALAHCYRIAATRRGITPSAMQAAVWVAIRGRAN